MKMSQLDRQTLVTTLEHLEGMHKANTIESEWYYKALVDGAHQHLLCKELGQVLALLDKVPASYFSDTIHKHMDADPAYAEQVFDIATVLVNNNIVHLSLTDLEKAATAEA